MPAPTDNFGVGGDHPAVGPKADSVGAPPLVAVVEPDDSVTDSLDSAVVPAAKRRRLILITLGIAAGTILLDQLTKIWALYALADGHRIELLGEYLSLRLLRNPGAAFGLGYGYTWVLTVVVVGVIVVLLRVMRRIGSLGWAWALGMLLGGAIGNLIDRLFRAPGFAHGHVIDFIAYWNWFVGNVADIAIVAAAGLVILLTFRGIGMDGSREPSRKASATSSPVAIDDAAPVERVEPVESVQPVGLAEPAESMEPVELVEPVDSSSAAGAPPPE